MLKTIFLRTLPLALAAIALAGCPANNSANKTQSASAPASPPVPAIEVCMVFTGLGLADGAYVRDANRALVKLEKDGVVDYSSVGELPIELIMDLGYEDVGLPVPGSTKIGEMTVPAAEALLDEGIECELLVLTTPLLIEPAIERIDSGNLIAQAILVLDNEGYKPPAATPPVPVYVVRYNIKDGAFLCGVAAAQSSISSFCTAIAYDGDPQADEFISAVIAGAKYHKSSSFVANIVVPADPVSGLVTPRNFRTALNRVTEEMGPTFQSNHYILSLGRATPTVMRELTSKGYVLGGYSDYRNIRPARIVGCIEKYPGVALEIILGKAGSAAGLGGLFTNGFFEVSMADGAVGFTSFDKYTQYNPDGEDIEDVVEGVKALIEVGELDADY